MSIVGSTLLEPPFELPLHSAAVDVLLLFILFIGWRGLLLRRSEASRLFRQIAPWLYVHVAGLLLGLWGVGLTSWGIAAIARNVLPVIVCIVLLGLLVHRPATQKLLVTTFAATGVFVALSVFVAGGKGLRASGVFNNPNYAAHFMACAVLLVPLLKARPAVRYLIVTFLCAGIFRTGSFAAILILLAAFAAFAWQKVGEAPRSLRAILRVGVAVGVLGSAWIGWSRLDGAEVDVGSGLSSTRLERSTSTRTKIWFDAIEIFQSHPLGIGPDGIRNRDFALANDAGEAHNDTLDTLVAGGIPAVVGMFAIVAVLWRTALRSARLRVALAGLIASSFTRQTWNFRHMWLFIALLLAIEITQRAAAPPTPAGLLAADANQPGGDASDDSIGRNVTGDDGARTENGAIADGDPAGDGHAGTDPNIVADDDWLRA